MKPHKNIFISIRIILLFSTAILLSFVPDQLHEFFGDWYCKTGSGIRIGFNLLNGIDGHWQYCNYCGEHDAGWHWGYRHWLWLFMGISLAIVQIVSIIIFINKEEVKNGK